MTQYCACPALHSLHGRLKHSHALARRAALRTITYSDLSGIEAANEAVCEAVANLIAFGTGDRCGWTGGSATGPQWASVLIAKFGTVAEKRELRADQRARERTEGGRNVQSEGRLQAL